VDSDEEIVALMLKVAMRPRLLFFFFFLIGLVFWVFFLFGSGVWAFGGLEYWDGWCTIFFCGLCGG
jgi:hypothetical protein